MEGNKEVFVFVLDEVMRTRTLLTIGELNVYLLTLTRLTPKQATHPQPPSGATFLLVLCGFIVCCSVVAAVVVFVAAADDDDVF